MTTPSNTRLPLMLLICFSALGITGQLSAQTDTPATESSDWRTQLQEQHQLTFELGYTLIFQMASDRDDDSNSLLSGSYDLGIEWAPIENGVLEHFSFKCSVSTAFEVGMAFIHCDTAKCFCDRLVELLNGSGGRSTQPCFDL